MRLKTTPLLSPPATSHTLITIFPGASNLSIASNALSASSHPKPRAICGRNRCFSTKADISSDTSLLPDPACPKIVRAPPRIWLVLISAVSSSTSWPRTAMPPPKRVAWIALFGGGWLGSVSLGEEGRCADLLDERRAAYDVHYEVYAFAFREVTSFLAPAMRKIQVSLRALRLRYATAWRLTTPGSSDN